MRVCVAGGSHCLFNSCCCCTSASLPARDTSGQAQPQPQQQPPRRHGGARHKERYGDPPRRPPPPGRVAGPQGHPSPPPPTRCARAAGHRAGGPGEGPGSPRGPGPARGGWARTPGRVGCGDRPRRGRGGASWLELSALPREPPTGRPGGRERGRGSPVFPWGGGPRGLTPPGRTGSLLFPH